MFSRTQSAIACLGLVGFRLVWGVVGSHFSRFASFWFGPRQAFGYLKQIASGQAKRHVGHNPTGSLAIYVLLALSVWVGLTGIMTLGGDEQQGLAASWFSFSQAQILKELHEIGAIAGGTRVVGSRRTPQAYAQSCISLQEAPCAHPGC
ncbi:cytochrome b/b6 domain-containing protein [Acidovorax sp.]|uniref:cytochrome b/b6 domain-containing protein n=1 Tax=Acidovorax sp. TaxID=1872122 RepID=UPI0025C351A9|nr:cytochrome b/b6 domain-containing protein [Acidovorax sp.]